MPGIGEVLALPPPEEGGLTGPLPLAQVTNEGEIELENGEKIKPVSVATHTRTIGMIHPPPDVRSIVDKTAQFVARNGPEFERRILANEKGNVKFNFLKSEDPYHAYYQHRVTEFRAQIQAPAQAPASIPADAAAAAAAAPKAADGVGVPALKEADVPKVEPEAKPAAKVLEPPEAEQYTIRLPEGLTGLDLDIIKLTAQFVARNGKSFLNGLTSREHSSQQFYFLKPTHSMFTFFTALADAYSKVLMPPKGLGDRLKKDSESKTVVLERCLQRLEWERSQERARQKAEDEIEQERMQMALIDWHDFVVVETIEFADEEDDELPQPMTLEEVIRRSKALATEEDEEEIAQAGKEMEMDMDEEEVELVEDGMRAASLEDGPKSDGTTAGMEVDPPMRIVKNWKRPEERAALEKDPTKFVVSPITGELIPNNEMAEHMRISLIDPKYKEQKERMMAKLRETTLATDDEISRNIVGLAKTRPDIFGTTEEEVSNAVKAEIEKKKEEPKQVIWDGHTGSISRTANQAMAQTMTLEEQIAAIHREKANLTPDGRPLPGPAVPPGPKLAPTPQRPLPPPPGLAPNIPRALAPAVSGVPTSAPPAPALVQRPAILPTPPPMRPPPQAPPPIQPNPLLARPPPAPLPPPMAPPPTALPQYPPPPRPFPPGMGPAMPMPTIPAMPAMVPPPPPPPAGLPPLPPPEEAPPPPPEEPEPKRQKVDEVQLIPEDQFLAQHPGPVRISVSVPVVEGEGNLKGQVLELTMQSLSETIFNVKEKIATELALPANKQKLNSNSLFLKVLNDKLSLAHYNIGSGETLTLGLRERGGRKRG